MSREDFEVGDIVGAIVCNGQFDSNCTILEIKRRLFKKSRYLVKYVLNVQGHKGQVLEFFGDRYPIPSSPSYKKISTEWVDKVWEIKRAKPKADKASHG